MRNGLAFCCWVPLFLGGGAQQRVDAVPEDLRQYSHGVVQSDDITALAVFLG